MARWVPLGLVVAVGLSVLLPGVPATLAEPPAGGSEGEATTALSPLLPFGFRGHIGARTRDSKVESALGWLARYQTHAGKWQAGTKRETRAEYDNGVSAIATLAFLGAGYTHRGPEVHRVTVSKALRHLTSIQQPDGCLGPKGFNRFVYAHAFAALALVEAYGMTGDTELQRPAQRALDFIAVARNPNFAWRYGVRPGDNDTSVTACMWAPLHAARLVNGAAKAAKRPEPLVVDEDAAEGVRSWMDKVTDPDFGRAGYQLRGAGPGRYQSNGEFAQDKSESSTAAAVWCRQTLDPTLTSAAAAAASRLVEKFSPTSDGEAFDLFYWYFGSLAMRSVGGPAWDRWWASLDLVLGETATMDADGVHWSVADPWTAEAGQIYTTALATLCLESPWRYPKVEEIRLAALAALAASDLDVATTTTAIAWVGWHRGKGDGKALRVVLASSDVRVRRAVASVLAENPAEVDAGTLAKALGDPDTAVREAMVRALGRVGGTPAVRALAKALTDSAATVRARAADALYALGREGKAVEAALRTALLDEAISVRASAARALWAATRDSAASVPVLTAALEAPDDATRIVAADALAEQGAAAVAAEPALAARLADPSPAVGVGASRALWSVTGKTRAEVGPLSHALTSADAGLRRLAVDTFATFGLVAAEGSWSMAPALRDRDDAVRRSAAAAMGALGREGRDAVPALRSATWDANPAVSKTASEALSHIEGTGKPGGKPKPGAALVDPKTLESLLRSPTTYQSLRTRGPVDPAWAPALLDLAKSTEVPVRVRAWETFGALPPPIVASAVPALTAAAADPDPRVRTSALRALRMAGPDAPAGPVFLAGAADPDERVRTAALDGLSALPGPLPSAVPALLAAVKEGDPARLASACALIDRWKVNDPAITAALLAALDGVPVPARSGPVLALAASRPWTPRVVAALEDILVRAEGTRAAATVEEALISGAQKDAEVLTLLMSAWSDTRGGSDAWERVLRGVGETAAASLASRLRAAKPEVRWHAVWALARFGKSAVKTLPTVVASLRAKDEPALSEIAKMFRQDDLVRPALTELMGALKSTDPSVRGGAAQVLGHMGTLALPARAALTQAHKIESELDTRALMRQALADLAVSR